MNKDDFVRNAFIGAASVGIVIFAVGVAKTYRRGKSWGVVQAAVNRRPEDKRVFSEYEEAKKAANDIFQKERETLDTETVGLKKAYDVQAKITDEITAKEQAAIAAHKSAVESDYREAKTAADALIAREKQAGDDILKNDDAYQALKLAKKELKAAEKDTSSIVKKMKAREETLRQQVKASRTEAEKAILKKRDRLAAESKYGYSGYEQSVIDGRSEEEKQAFRRLNEIGAELHDKSRRLKDIQGLRSSEETAAVRHYEEMAKTVSDIRKREEAEIDPAIAVAGYLRSNGYTATDVRLIGAIPIVLGGVLYFILAKWWGNKVATIANSMNKVGDDGLLINPVKMRLIDDGIEVIEF